MKKTALKTISMLIMLVMCMMPITLVAQAASPTMSTNVSSSAILVGNSVQITPTLKNTKATIKSKKFTTSNSKVASVTKNGTVKGKKKGTATITVKVTDSKKKTYTKKVKVTVQSKTSSKTPYISAPGSVSVLKDNSYQIKPSLKNSKSSISSSTYKTSDSKIATVSNNGVVKAVKAGTVTITVTSKTKNKHTLVKKVKVIVKSKAASDTPYTTLSGKTSILVGNSAVLSTKLNNSKSSISKTTYKSSNTSIATISSNGTVKGIKAGTVTITATSTHKNGHTSVSKLKITIVKSPNSSTSNIVASPSSKTLETNQSQKIAVSLKNSKSSASSYAYISSKTSVATVNASGTVKAVSPGTATITVTVKTKDNQTLITKVNITVVAPPKKLNVNEVRTYFMQFVNEDRISKNKQPLVIEPKLQKAAELRARELETLFDHVRPNGTICFSVFEEFDCNFYIDYGENVLYRGTAKTEKELAKGIYEQWKASPGHYENMLKGNYNETGIGIYIAPNGTVYSAQLFGETFDW